MTYYRRTHPTHTPKRKKKKKKKKKKNISLHVHIKIFLGMNLFPNNSSYSFHRIGLKLGGQLDHKRLLFQGYSTPSFDRVNTILLFKEFSDMAWFSDNSCYSLHFRGQKV